jgi:asparagine synthase (glutamine-hydrolysing)
MSGIVALWHWDGEPIGAALDRVMAALAPRAIDGADRWVASDGTLGLGHLHWWTTPQEQGERQPLRQGPIALAFDGRLDNRAELSAALGIGPTELAPLSDAALVLAAWERWGEESFRRLAGPFVVVVVDEAARRVVWARDALGRRTLFWYGDERGLALASEPAALLAHPRVDGALDEVWLAHLFAVRQAPPGRSAFAAVREALPAQVVVVTQSGLRARRFWSPEDLPDRAPARVEALVEECRFHLERAVARRLRSTSPVGVLLSGGMDSAPIAAMAAQQMGSGRLASFSWCFDSLPACDERQYIRPIVEQLGLAATWVPADDAWGFRDYDCWPHDPNTPEYSCYRFLMDRVVGVARAAGVTCLLNGAGGDEVYDAAEHWLADLLAEERWREAWAETRAHGRRYGWPAVLTSRSLRQAALDPLRRRGLRRRLAPPSAPGWLTPHAAQLIDDHWQPPVRLPNGRVAGALQPYAAASALPEAFHAHRLGVEQRMPFTDLDLVGFLVGLPGYLAYHRGERKWIMRQAMAGRLPEIVLRRQALTDLNPLYDLGARDREAGRVAALVARSVDWRGLVRPDWVAAARPGQLGDGLAEMAIWYCLSYGTWRSNGAGPEQRHAPVAR